MFCDCVWYCQAWLWLGLTSGRNRCLRAQAPLRAQLHCVRSRSVASEVEHPCGCLDGIMGEAQTCPPGPYISCLQLQCLWPLLFGHYFHQAGTEMQICDITAVFCHYHINMDKLARWTGAQWGWRDMHLKIFHCVSGMEKWKSSRTWGGCLKVWRDWTAGSQSTPCGDGGCQSATFPDLTHSPHLSSDPQGPLRCQRERALRKEVDEAGWRIENCRELVNVRKGWWGTQGWIKSFGLYAGAPELWSSDLGWTTRHLVEMPMPRTLFQEETLTTILCAKPET